MTATGDLALAPVRLFANWQLLARRVAIVTAFGCFGSNAVLWTAAYLDRSTPWDVFGHGTVPSLIVFILAVGVVASIFLVPGVVLVATTIIHAAGRWLLPVIGPGFAMAVGVAGAVLLLRELGALSFVRGSAELMYAASGLSWPGLGVGLLSMLLVFVRGRLWTRRRAFKTQIPEPTEFSGQ
ncbi:hypothetical protein CLV78_109152 [Aliiruegeria haliotis]|uniref:Uncharacterized protein n=1 Tax=Aliiruegeria haliotis TaxID=1280846 RepID=A0A2T0RK35_9RHOB|nr:hypothetical protein [Aliiruegeria haliotis]PRY21539.1 hypothetical protein CLV78_109152 [Aliiruegeria haliotis]